MSGPWEDYQQQAAPAASAEAGPWADFQQSAQTGGDAAGLAKAYGTGLVKSAPQILGMPVAIANAVRKAYAGYNKTPYNPETDDIKYGSTDAIQKGLDTMTGPMHVANGPAEEAAQTAGEWTPALLGGPETLAAKALTRIAIPYGASKLASAATEGTPYQDLATLGAGLGTGAAGMKVARGRAENPPVSSRTLAADGAHPDVVAQVKTLEDIQKSAKDSSDPTNQALRTKVADLLQDPAQSAQFSPETKAALQDFSDQSGGVAAKIGNTGAGSGTNWGVPTIAGLAFHAAAGPVVAAKGAAIGLRKYADFSANSAINQIKTAIAKEPPPQAAPALPGVGPTGPKIAPAPQPWSTPAPQAQPLPGGNVPLPSPWGARPPQPSVPLVPPQAPAAAPTMPDPVQLKAQMDQLVNQRKVLATNAQTTQDLLRKLAGQNQPAAAVDQTASQAQDAMQLMAARRANAKLNAPPPAAPTPQAPPEINPLALPSSITTPAKNIMGGASGVQSMRAAADPLAKYEAAVAANASKDRQNTSALKQDATGLMAARKAAQVDEVPEPEPIDHTNEQVKDATQLMAARRANAKLSAAAAPVAAPVAPPVIVKLSKKANGSVKETPAPTPEPAPEAPVELPQSDYSHLPRAAAAKLITDRVFAAGKKISVTPEEYQAGVMEKLTAKDKIADDMAKAMPEVEHQDINAHLQGAKTQAQAVAVGEHYSKLHPEAAAAIKLALAKKRLNAGWAK